MRARACGALTGLPRPPCGVQLARNKEDLAVQLSGLEDAVARLPSTDGSSPSTA